MSKKTSWKEQQEQNIRNIAAAKKEQKAKNNITVNGKNYSNFYDTDKGTYVYENQQQARNDLASRSQQANSIYDPIRQLYWNDRLNSIKEQSGGTYTHSDGYYSSNYDDAEEAAKEDRNTYRNEYFKSWLKNGLKSAWDNDANIELQKAKSRYEQSKDDVDEINTKRQEEVIRILNKNSDITELLDKAYEAKKTASDKVQNAGYTDDLTAVLTNISGVNNSNYDTSAETENLEAYKKELNSKLKQIGVTSVSADDLLDYYTGQQNIADSQKTAEDFSELAQEHPLAAGTARVLMSPYATMSNIATAIGDKITGGNYVYSAANAIQDARRGVKSGVEEKTESFAKEKNLPFADKNISILGKDFGNIYSSIYDAIDMGAENVYTSILAGGGITGGIKAAGEEKAIQALATGLFTSSTMGEDAAQLKSTGLDIKSVYAQAGKNAVINFITEMLGTPLEKIDNGLATVGSEALEEVIGNALSNIDDIVRLQDEGEIAQAYQDYISQGYSEKEALALTIKNLLADDIYSAGMAAFSTMGMAGSQALTELNGNTGSKTKIGKNVLNNNDLQSVVATAASLNENSKAFRQLRALNESNEEISNKDIGKLYTQTVKDIQKDFSHAVDVDELTQKYYKYMSVADENMQADIAQAFLEAAPKVQELQNKTDEIETNAQMQETQPSNHTSEASQSDIRTDNAESLSNPNAFTLPAVDVNTNSKTTLTGVAKSSGGDLLFYTKNGETISINDVQFPDSDIKQVALDASKYDINGAAVYMQNAPDVSVNSNAYSYYSSYAESVYNLGRSGIAWNRVKAKYGDAMNTLGINVAKSFYDAGAADNSKAGFEKTLAAKKTPGATVLAESISKEQQAEADLLGAYAKSIGREIVIVDDTEKLGYGQVNGFYKNGKIVLPLNADGGMMSAYFGHELFHDLKATSRAQAQELEDFVIHCLKDKADYNYDARVDELIELNHFNGTRAQQVAQANEEIAANACFTVLSERQNFESLVKENKSLAQKVRDFFADFIKKIENALKDIAGINAEYRALKDEDAAKQKILDMFDECLKASDVTVKNNTINSDSEIKYSKIEDFERLNKDSLNNIKMRNGIVVNNETELLKAIRTSLDDKLTKNNYSFGAIPKNTIERLTKDLGNSVNFKNGQYAFVFSSDDIKHISKHFSNENKIASALIKLYDTVVNYDNVDIEKNGSQTRLIFKKSYVNADYLSVEIISNKKRAFDLVTYYITQKNSGTQNNSLANTTKSGELASQGVSFSTNNSIPNSKENVKYSHKEAQFNIIQESNPAKDEYHTWIRNKDEILTLEEAVNDSDWIGYENYNPDFTATMAKEAIKNGKITVYSSYPIKNGVFVSPSKMEAQSYSGNGKVYRLRANIEDIAWIDPTQGQYAKLTDNLNPTDNEDIRYSQKEQSYSYEALTAKPDMPITEIDDKKDYSPNKSTRENVVNNALVSALNVGYKDKSGNTFVYVNDIDTNVMVSKRGLRHSLDRRLSIVAPVTENIGKILKNSVRINELTPEFDTIEKSYALIGIAKNNNNEPYVVSFVVNRASNEITSIDVLYAVNAKKEATALIEPELSSQSDVSLTASAISISDLLDCVNKYYPDILSEDVLKHYGYDSRPEGTIGESALYSLKEKPIDYNAVLEENEELSEMNEDLQRMLKLTSEQNEKLRNEFKITDRHNISNQAVDKVAAQLRSKYSSSYSKTSLVSRISALYDYMANAGSDIDMGYTWRKALDIAKNIIDNSQQKDATIYNEYKELRSRIRSTAIRVPQTVQDSFEDFNAFRKENFGRLRLSNEGIELASFYNELAAEYPEFFDINVSEEQQLEALANFFEATSPVYYNVSEGNAESMGLNMEQYANLIAGDIFDKYFDVPEVQTVAEKHKKEIDTLKMHYRNQIDDMKQSYKERYEERLKEVKAENAERVSKLRKDKAEALAKQKAHFEDVSRKSVNRRKSSEIKRKIKNIKKQLDSKLFNPSETSYVPQYLVKEIASVCDMITDADRYWKNGNSKAESTIFKLDALHRQYEKLAKDSNYEYASEFDSNISDNISALADSLNGKQISELTLSQLEDIYNIIKDIKNSLVDATNQIGKEEKISNHELGIRIINEINSTKGKSNDITGKYEMDTLNPIRAIRKITEYNENSELYKLFLELNNGQRKADKFISDVSKPFDILQKDIKNYKKFTEELIDTEIKDNKGENLKLTENQLAQLVMTVRRAQGVTHIERSGFIVSVAKLLSKNEKSKAKIEGQNVDAISIDNITKLYDLISDYGRNWINAAEKLFNEQGKKAINNTSTILKHRKLATVENYIPLIVDSNYTNAEIEGVKVDKTIEGMGCLKSTVANAGQPIIIQGLNTVVDKYIDDVSKYYGLAIPIRNFNKVYKIQTSKHYDSNLSKTSVKTVLENKWGSYGTELIDSVLSDLQTSRTPKTNPSFEFVGKALDKVQQGFVQATLAGNISVTIKQAASYPTARAVLSPTSLIKGLVGFTYQGSKLQDLYNEIDEHTGSHYKRRQGMSTQEIGDLTKENAFIKKIPAIINPMKWIQVMDVQTTAALWIAAKSEIKVENPSLDTNSIEYWQKVTELYDYTIETTQPNYDVLHRPEVQKTSNKLVKSFVMFKTQPLQNSGIFYDALFAWKAKQSQYNTNKTDENKKAVHKAKKTFVKAVISQIEAAMTFATMSLLANAIKHTMSGYRDDDDKVTSESVLKGYFGSIASLLASVILPIGGSELYEIGNEVSDYVKAKNNDEDFSASSYDIVSMPLATTINNLIDAVTSLVETTGDFITGDKTADDEFKAFVKTMTRSATILGIPFDNAMTYGKGIWYNIKDAVNGELGNFEYGIDHTDSERYQKLYEYTMSGDEKHQAKVYQELVDSETDEDSILNGYAIALFNNDMRVAEAGIYYSSGDMQNMYSLINELINDGFTEEQAVKAVKKYQTALETAKRYLDENDEAKYQDQLNSLLQSGFDEGKIVDAIHSIELEESEDKISYIYNADDYLLAVIEGDTSVSSHIKQSILDIDKQNGKSKEASEKTLKSKLKSFYYDQYIAGSSSAQSSIKSKLMKTGLYDKDDFAEWLADSYNSNGEHGTDELQKAVESDYNSAQAYISERVSAKVEAGSTEDSAKSGIKKSIRNLYKDEYINGNADTRANIITYMTNTGLYGSREDVIAYVNKYWVE